jgi:hypothetical protein
VKNMKNKVFVKTATIAILMLLIGSGFVGADITNQNDEQEVVVEEKAPECPCAELEESDEGSQTTHRAAGDPPKTKKISKCGCKYKCSYHTEWQYFSGTGWTTSTCDSRADAMCDGAYEWSLYGCAGWPDE